MPDNFDPDKYISDFMYYGVCRPLNYLSRLLEEVLSLFAAGVKAMKDGAGVKLMKDVKTHKPFGLSPEMLQCKSLPYKFVPFNKYIPPYIYWDQVYHRVDREHFPGIDKVGGDFAYLMDGPFKFPPVNEVDNTVAKDFPDKWANATAGVMNTQSPWLRDKNSNYFKIMIWTLLMEDITEATAYYGFSPKLQIDISDVVRKNLLR